MKPLEIKKILVPIDFSNNSFNALQTAIALAKTYKAHIKMMYVADSDFELYAYHDIINAGDPADFLKTLSLLSDSVKKSENIICDVIYEKGHIANLIVQTALHEKADLIVMGKNGNSGNRKNYAGSHTYEVIKKAACPVLLVPSGKMREQFKNFLFPVRPVLSVLEKYEAVKELLKRLNANLNIINLRNPNYVNELHIISRLVEILKSKTSEDNIETNLNYYFKDDDFAAHILSVTQKEDSNIDVLVITAELDSRIRDFYIGTYAQQIIHQAQVPVLVIRPTVQSYSKDYVLKELEKQIALN